MLPVGGEPQGRDKIAYLEVYFFLQTPKLILTDWFIHRVKSYQQTALITSILQSTIPFYSREH